MLARRYLLCALLLVSAALPAAAQDMTVQQLSCRGNEPFWSFQAGQDTAQLSELGSEERSFSGRLRRLGYLDPPWSVWRGREVPAEGSGGQPGEIVATLRAEVCLDTMSEEGGPFDQRVLLSMPDGRLLTGCCRSVVALDQSEAPLADFEDLPRGDWTQLLPRLAAAVEGCLLEGFSDPVELVLGAWPLPNGQALVRARSFDGGREDCIVEEDSGRVLMSDSVSPTAGKGRSEGAPSLLPKREAPPLVTCGRLERVELTPGDTLGWLHYKGPDCTF